MVNQNIYLITKEIIKKNKKEIFFKFLTSLLLRSSLFIIPIMYSIALDNVPLAKYSVATKFFLLALGTAVLYYFFAYLNDRVYYKLYDKMYKMYNWEIIKCTQENSAYSLSRFTLGEYSNLFNSDIAIIVDFIDTGIIRIIKMLEFLVIFTYFLAISKVIFAISIAVSLLGIIISLISGKKTEKYNLARKVSLDGYISDVNNVFMGMKEIKSLNILSKVKEPIEKSNGNFLYRNTQYNLFYNWSNYLVLGIIEFVRYGLLVYGVYLISKGQFQLGSLILIYNYYQKMVENFTEICALNVGYRNFKVSLKRINKIFEYRQENKGNIEKIDDYQGDIVFENVLYGNRQDPILNKVSFTIPCNSLSTITGKIGSGKTGIFDLLMRINRQHEGSITIHNINIQDIHEDLYYDLVAIARKTPTFFEMSIMDNLKLVSNDEEKIISVCQAMKIDDDIMKLPEGYQTSIHAREVNTELKQMLGIARVLVKDSEIMMFDEILDTLDDSNQRNLFDLFSVMKETHTILIISRLNDILSHSDIVITMERNSIKTVEKK